MAGAAGSLGAAMVGSRMAETAVPSAEPAPPPVASPWTDRQFEIYLAGRRGVKPGRPVSVEQLEKAAQHLAWLRRTTRLPIIVKGILDPEDARRALAEGVAAIGVSNHGGRQVDGAVAALDALPRVVEAVRDRADVIFDSGIRRGADVVKALALGARCVRPLSSRRSSPCAPAPWSKAGPRRPGYSASHACRPRARSRRGSGAAG